MPSRRLLAKLAASWSARRAKPSAAAPTTTAAQLRAGLDAQGIKGAEIQQFGSAGNFVIRARVGTDHASTEGTSQAVKAALNATLGEGKYTVGKVAAVSPKVGGELRTQALLAVLTSFLFVLIYLAVRFEWRFGLAAIIATAHDILAKTAGGDQLLEIAMGLEEIALADDYFIERKLYPNVDFYTGLIYKSMGFPTRMFTVLFALGRLPGWIAQWREMMEDPTTKIGRPRQVYTGSPDRSFVPLAER